MFTKRITENSHSLDNLRKALALLYQHASDMRISFKNMLNEY